MINRAKEGEEVRNKSQVRNIFLQNKRRGEKLMMVEKVIWINDGDN